MKTIHLHIEILAGFANIALHFLKSRYLRNLLPVLFIIVASISNIAAQASNPGEIIAYDRCYRDFDTWDIYCGVYLVSADGSGQGYAIDDAINPSWSPDGSRIAFVRYSQGGLFVYNLNDGSITSVHSGGESPAWSPDGTKLAFSSGELYVMNADGSAVVQLTNNMGFRGQPSWSSDRETIAFDCEVESGNRDICSINADGTDFIRLTSDAAWDSGATFSPDGSAIALVTTRYGFERIATMNPDGTGISQVGAGIWGFQLAWSSDSRRIAFVQPSSDCEADGRICPDSVLVMNRDGSGLQAIASGNRPTWAGSGNPMAWFLPGTCNGLDCTFDGTLSWGGSGTLSYNWDFGDGTNSSSATNTHTYAAAGTYRVTLTVTDSTGATGSRSRDTIVDSNVFPTARFTYSCTGWQCTFDGSGSSDPDGTIASYSWIFGDGGGSGYGQTATHSYNAAGPFTVTLYVTDNRGGIGSEQQVVNLVANSRPVASFTVVCTELTCAFDGSNSSDADGAIVNYDWNFGDGTSASGVTASHTYARVGTFTAGLAVTDNIGGTGVQWRVVSVSIANSPPVASFTAVCTELTCAFNGSGSSDADGVIVNYTWNFGDGNTGASGVTASHTYVGAGTFTASLTVTDNIGGTGVQVRSVTVSQTMHIGDLDGTRTNDQNAWTALVTITVHDGSHNPVSNATVSGSWNIGGAGSCTTDGSGRCLISKSAISKKNQSAVFTVTNVTQNTRIYDAVTNHDPDGDSNGTSVTVRSP